MDENNLLDRFLRYVKIDTRSVEDGEKHPSSSGQTRLIDLLRYELMCFLVPEEQLTRLDDGSLLVELPATPGHEGAPLVRLAAHVDTSPEVSGVVKPMVHRYQGGDIVLPLDDTIIPAKKLIGLEDKEIITSSGDSLLGADDKAGVAALMEIIRFFLESGSPHGPLIALFFVDEEIDGAGFVKHLPPEKFGQGGVFLTLDGGRAGLVDHGCFFGAKKTVVVFKGHNTHPGVGGLEMRSAIAAAADFVNLVTRAMSQPWTTSGDQGFAHVTNMSGGAGQAEVSLILRSFNRDELAYYQAQVENIARLVAVRLGVEVSVSPLDFDYVTTEVAIARHPKHLEVIKAGLAAHGLDMRLELVRGGTDGAMLNKDSLYQDIPAPNLGLGGGLFHEKGEFLVFDELVATILAIEEMISIYADMKADEF